MFEIPFGTPTYLCLGIQDCSDRASSGKGLPFFITRKTCIKDYRDKRMYSFVLKWVKTRLLDIPILIQIN